MVKYILLILLLSSCSANWHLKQAIKKEPEILLRPAEVKTVYDTMTVITEGERVDTVFHASVDTFYIEREKVRSRIVKIHDTVEVEVWCEPDTIRVPYKSEVTLLQPEVTRDTILDKLTKQVGKWILIVLA